MSVTRRDLPDGVQAVQSSHALINFLMEHPIRAGDWFRESNYLVQLTVADETELNNLISECKEGLLDITVFKEPDLNNQVTAIAIEPSPLTQKLVRKLPLLFNN